MTVHRCITPGCEHETDGLRCAWCRGEPPAAPVPVASPPSASDPPRENTVQEDCRQALLDDGWEVYRVGQRNARGTQDAGVSDLLCFHPALGIWFVEAKAEDGAQSIAQRKFEIAVRAAGGRYDLIWSIEQLQLRLQVLHAAAAPC